MKMKNWIRLAGFGILAAWLLGGYMYHIDSTDPFRSYVMGGPLADPLLIQFFGFISICTIFLIMGYRDLLNESEIEPQLGVINMFEMQVGEVYVNDLTGETIECTDKGAFKLLNETEKVACR